jgi:branched-subunit amino acid transport protein
MCVHTLLCVCAAKFKFPSACNHLLHYVVTVIVCALHLGHIVLNHVDANLVLTSQCKGLQGLHQFYLSNLSKH